MCEKKDIYFLFLRKINKGNLKLRCSIILIVGYQSQHKTIQGRHVYDIIFVRKSVQVFLQTLIHMMMIHL
jgi:hypothetical protein